MSNSATFYGVGLGPGDPELLTLKAARILRECDLLALPEHSNESTVYAIATTALPELRDKPLLPLSIPMISDRAAWEAHHDAAAAAVVERLAAGQSVAFLTLGDPSVYASYIYLHRRVLAAGQRAVLVPGVPSFCAAGALVDGLVEGNEPLHVYPAFYGGVDEALAQRGTKVFMKAGRQLPAVRDAIRDHGLEAQARLVTRCGLPGERVYDSLDDVEDAGYFSIFIVKDKREG